MNNAQQQDIWRGRLQYVLKVFITALLVVAIAEAAKRWTLLGAVVASLPLTTVLAMIWLYFDTGDVEKVTALSRAVFWIVIPSLLFFVIFPLIVKGGYGFWLALAGSALGTASGYFAYLKLLGWFGVRI